MPPSGTRESSEPSRSAHLTRQFETRNEKNLTHSCSPDDPEWLVGDEAIAQSLKSGGVEPGGPTRSRDHAHLIRKSMPKLDGAYSARTPLVTSPCSPGVESESRIAQSVSAPRGCSADAVERLRGCPRLRVSSTVGPAKGRWCRKTRDVFHPWRPTPFRGGRR